MAFKQHKTDIPATSPFCYPPAKAGEVYALGEALVASTGAVTKCGATATPDYICQRGFTAKEGDSVPCVRTNGLTIYETSLSAAGTALKIGDKVTLSADATEVTATTASGVAEIVEMDGTAAGSAVRVRFKAAAESA